MKRKLITSVIISCYILQVFIILSLYQIIPLNSFPVIVILLSIPTTALALANIVNAIVTHLNHKNNLLVNNRHSKTMLVFKLIMIPFYIFNFFIWFVFVSILFLWGGFLLIPIGIAFTYIILLSSSAHVITELYVYYTNKKITFKFFIVHSILQLFFAIDIIDYIYIHRTLNKIYKNEQNRSV